MERAYLVHIAAATLLVLLAGIFSALTVPLFGGPDERNHYNSVVRVIDGGGWPLPYEAQIKPSVSLAWLEAGRAISSETTLATVPSAENRSSILSSFDYQSKDVDNMVQHPPLYYYLTAGIVSVTDLDTLKWDQAMLLMRFISVFLVALSVPAIAGSVRLITGSRSLGVLGAYALLSIPFFTGFAGLVSNDTLLVPTISGALYLIIRAGKAPAHQKRLLAAAGVLFGLALLTKGFSLFAIPLIFGLSVVSAFAVSSRWRTRVLLSLIPSLVAAAIGGWWWIRNLVLVGSVQPSVAGNLRIPLDEPVANIDFLRFFANFWMRFNSLFWARGVRPSDGGSEFPVALLAIAGTILVIAIIVVVVFSRHRLTTLLLLMFPAIIIATLFANSFSIFRTFGIEQSGIQGRYVFGGILAYSMVFATFFGILARKTTPAVRRWIFLVVTVGSVLIAWANNWWMLLTAWPNKYSLDGTPLATAALYFGIPPAAYVIVTIAAALIFIGALVVSSRVSQPTGFASDLEDGALDRATRAPVGARH